MNYLEIRVHVFYSFDNLIHLVLVRPLSKTLIFQVIRNKKFNAVR